MKRHNIQLIFIDRFDGEFEVVGREFRRSSVRSGSRGLRPDRRRYPARADIQRRRRSHGKRIIPESFKRRRRRAAF